MPVGLTAAHAMRFFLLLILLLKGVEGNPLTSLSTVGTRVGWLIELIYFILICKEML